MANNTKQQTINTFTGGLNTDLHPLTTPNDILTDCINGTFITYNGNEYILQNDMGNYKLDKAKLWADYIPIGIKEYGNIIYIVSYNPIDKKCQIGSYPSPQTLFDNSEYGSKNENYQGVQVYNLSPKWTWPTSTQYELSEGIVNSDFPNSSPTGEHSIDVLFTNTKPNQNLRVFFPEDGLDIKDTFLNPGDKYFLKKDTNEDSHWKFQKCDYYSLTESKEAIKIEEGLVVSDPYDYTPEKLRNVKWEIPGWLSYRPSLLEPTSFDLYLTDIKIPALLSNNNTRASEGTGELSFEVQGQLTISTSEDWKLYYDNLKVYFEYNYTGNKWENDLDNGSHVNSEEGGIPTNYGNTIDILTFNNRKSIEVSKQDVENNKTVIIRATPYIIDGDYGIVYDNLTVTYTINLGELYQVDQISCFNTYKYLVDEDSININFSILSPTSNLSSITCKYRIHEIADNFSGISRNSEYLDIDSLNLLGQNILTLEFESSSIEWFKKEEIYIFELAFFNTNDSTPLHRAAEFLITSKLFNDFYSSNSKFQDISLTEWTSKIKDNVTVDLNVSDYISNNINYEYIKYAVAQDPNDVFNVNFYQNSDKTFITENDYPNNNFILDINSSETEAINTVVNDGDLSKSSYYGCVSTHISNLEYTIPTPKILNYANGLWGDLTWNNTIESSVTTIENNKQNTRYNSINTVPYVLKTKNTGEENNIDSSVYTVLTKSNFSAYTSDKFEGLDGDRWYLYRNLFFNFNTEWYIKELLLKLENTFWNIENVEKLEGNTLLVGGMTRKAYRVVTWTDEANNNTVAGLIDTDTDSNFDFGSLQVRDLSVKNIEGRTNDGGKLVQLVDDYVTKHDYNWTFIPVCPVTRVGQDNDKTKRGWDFGDGDVIDCYTGKGNYSNGIGIICKESDNSKTVAVINFITPELIDSFEGIFIGYDKSNIPAEIAASKWLVSSIKTKKNVIPITDTEYLQYMHQCVGVLLFGLGIQLYGLYNVRTEYKDFIVYSGMDLGISSQNTFNINYKRNDTLRSVVYKKVDIKSELQSINLDSLFTNIGVKPNFYKTNNLRGTFSDTVISNKTNEYTYTDKYAIQDVSVMFTSFISKLNSLLNDKIQEWENTRNYSANKIYCDLTSEESRGILSEVQESLIFEYKSNMGKFYYNGFPDVVWKSRKNKETRHNFVRGIDWSTSIMWSNINSILKPTIEFRKRELKETIK